MLGDVVGNLVVDGLFLLGFLLGPDFEFGEVGGCSEELEVLFLLVASSFENAESVVSMNESRGHRGPFDLCAVPGALHFIVVDVEESGSFLLLSEQVDDGAVGIGVELEVGVSSKVVFVSFSGGDVLDLVLSSGFFVSMESLELGRLDLSIKGVLNKYHHFVAGVFDCMFPFSFGRLLVELDLEIISA